jgi:hypothetical protein
MENEISMIVLGAIPAGVVLLLIVDWLRVVRLYDGPRTNAFALMMGTVWASQSRWLLFAAAASTLGTTYLASDPLFWANVPVEAAVALFAVPLSALMVRLRPPAILFLGSSGLSQELYRRLRLRARRYRVIAFLAPPNDLTGRQALAMDDSEPEPSTGRPPYGVSPRPFHCWSSIPGRRLRTSLRNCDG